MDAPTVFALDIGTRKIAGLLLEQKDQGYCIKHAVMIEQLPGAMQDGQIHDITKVARVIDKVKGELERTSNQQLTEVAVAAAGRSLFTKRGVGSRKLAQGQRLTSADV